MGLTMISECAYGPFYSHAPLTRVKVIEIIARSQGRSDVVGNAVLEKAEVNPRIVSDMFGQKKYEVVEIPELGIEFSSSEEVRFLVGTEQKVIDDFQKEVLSANPSHAFVVDFFDDNLSSHA